MGIIAGSISGVRVSNSSATILALLLFSVDIKKNPEVMQYLSHCFGKMGLPAVIRGSWTFTYNSGRKSIKHESWSFSLTGSICRAY